MSPTLRSTRDELERLQREVSPRVHLSSPGARALWAALEPELETFAREAELASGRAAGGLVDRGTELLTRLRRLRTRVWHDLEAPPSAPDA